MRTLNWRSSVVLPFTFGLVAAVVSCSVHAAPMTVDTVNTDINGDTEIQRTITLDMANKEKVL